MPPAASILIPTRRRREYLAVALASVAPQAAEHGAELIVVEDDPADPGTEQLAQADLLCFLDDDAEAWPGWLGALIAAAEAEPDHDAFGGPIRARLEGTNLHACGREPPPVTTLDLGPDDRDAEFVWGANLTLRRRALERAGGFDPGLDLYGDAACRPPSATSTRPARRACAISARRPVRAARRSPPTASPARTRPPAARSPR